MVEAHIRILPEHWGLTSIEAGVASAIFIKDNTQFSKIITTIPGNCYHVKKFCRTLGFRYTGQINDGIVYNNKLVPLEYHELNIKR